MGDYEKKLSGLYALDGKLPSRQYLRGMRQLLSRLGNPEQDFNSVIVTGTNGKGSVASMTASALSESGLKTGLYLSPHIDDFRERISIDGKWIPEKRFVEIYDEIKKASRRTEPVTVFEFATSMMFQYFSEEGVDCAVLEVGLGGRLDATNAARSGLGAITAVGLEHTEFLGSTLSSIAREKAGIARKNGMLFTAETKPEALNVIRSECARIGAGLVLAKRADAESGVNGQIRFKELKCTDFENEYLVFGLKEDYLVSLSMLGAHQGANCSVAVGLCESMGLEPEDIETGVGKAKLPCRLEVVSRDPLIVMDCAHNPHAAKALASSLGIFDYERLILVAGMMKDKDHEGFFKELGNMAEIIITNQPDYKKSIAMTSLFKVAQKFCNKTIGIWDVRCSVSAAKSIAGKKDLILIAGSIYMLSEARGNPLGVTQ